MREKISAVLKDETGSMSQLTWTLGSAIVTALIIVGAMVYAPATASNFWDSASDWIRSNFGF